MILRNIVKYAGYQIYRKSKLKVKFQLIILTSTTRFCVSLVRKANRTLTCSDQVMPWPDFSLGHFRIKKVSGVLPECGCDFYLCSIMHDGVCGVVRVPWHESVCSLRSCLCSRRYCLPVYCPAVFDIRLDTILDVCFSVVLVSLFNLE